MESSATGSQQQVAKIIFDDDVRRLALDQPTYTALQAAARKLFPWLPLSFHFVYEDDEGDTIVLNSDLEFQEALRVFKTWNHIPRLHLASRQQNLKELRDAHAVKASAHGAVESKAADASDAPAPTSFEKAAKPSVLVTKSHSDKTTEASPAVVLLKEDAGQTPKYSTRQTLPRRFGPTALAFTWDSLVSRPPFSDASAVEDVAVIHEADSDVEDGEGDMVDMKTDTVDMVETKAGAEASEAGTSEVDTQTSSNDESQEASEGANGTAADAQADNDSFSVTSEFDEAQTDLYHQSAARLSGIPFARVVGDETFRGCTAIEAGALGVKAWRFVNDGLSTWPEGVRMTHVGGEPVLDRTGSVVSSFKVPCAGPSQQVLISLPFQAPLTPGKSVSYWRLTTASGIRFGDRVWLDLDVQDHPAAKLFRTLEGQATGMLVPTGEEGASYHDLLTAPPAPSPAAASSVDAATETEPVTAAPAVDSTPSPAAPTGAATASPPPHATERKGSEDEPVPSPSAPPATTEDPVPSIPANVCLSEAQQAKVQQLLGMGLSWSADLHAMMKKHNWNIDSAFEDPQFPW